LEEGEEPFLKDDVVSRNGRRIIRAQTAVAYSYTCFRQDVNSYEYQEVYPVSQE
jgi:hypothetical protein